MKLQWPTALAVNPLDDTLHILDNDMVLKVTKDGKVLIVAGHPLHCPPKDPNINPLLTEDQAGPKLANEVILEHPQHITFAPNGYLYIVESDGKFINRVREVKTDGTIHHYVGDKSKCNCEDPECRCYDPDEVLATKILLNSPTAITVTADNVLHVSDMGNLRIHSIVATLSEPDRYGQYTVLYPQTQEIYIFNRFGQHVNTKNIITDQYVYNFTYSVNSYYGKLQAVTDTEGNRLTIRRSYTTQAEEIIPPGGQKCRFIMDNMGQLHLFIAADNATTKFTYLDNTGLLETKETSEGHTFVYEYDDNGRLASVMEPTGEHTTLSTDVDPSGAIARLSTDKRDRVALATNGNLLSVLHGKWLLMCSKNLRRLSTQQAGVSSLTLLFSIFLNWFAFWHFVTKHIVPNHINGLVQDCGNSSALAKPLYDTVIFLQNTHKWTPMARPQRSGVRCLLWVQSMI